MLYDDIAGGEDQPECHRDSYDRQLPVISTDNDSSVERQHLILCGLRKRIPECHLNVNLNSMPYGDVTVNLKTDNLTYGGYASPDRLISVRTTDSATAIVQATDDFVDDGDDNGTATGFVTLDNTSSKHQEMKNTTSVM